MVCSMENESVKVLVKDTISGKKIFTLQLTPSRAIDSIFKEVSKEFEYNVDDISLEVQLGPGSENYEVSNMFFGFSSLLIFILGLQNIKSLIFFLHIFF